MTSWAPFVIFYLGALAALATRGALRGAVMLAVPVIGAFNLYMMNADTRITLELFDYTLTLLAVDRMNTLFGYLFHLAAFLSIIYSLHVRDTTQHVAGLLYAGSALGAVYAGDMITLFVFWEIMAVSSVFLVLARKTETATRAAMRYLILQVLSGVVLMAGVLIRLETDGTLAFDAIGLGDPHTLSGFASWLILLAFGLKAGFPLLHNWLTDAYPEATPTGTVFLSAFTTKVAVFALARCFAGTEILVYVGVTMTMFPIFFAVIENDLRRVLSYSMINQIGFMVCGIGLGTQLAVNGAVSHAFNDVVFKALLFMSMGALLHRTGKVKCSELGGLYKSMPKTAVFCIVGAASISALPLFSGFVSKSMVMAAALEEGYPVVWLGLLFASVGVLEHAGIKIPFFGFFGHDSGIRCKEAPLNMLIAMALAAAICIFNGSYPWVLYSALPFPVDFLPYTIPHVLLQVQMLSFATLAFVLLKLSGLYPPELPGINIDAEWSYRWLLPRAARVFVASFRPLDKAVRDSFYAAIGQVVASAYRHLGPEGLMARSIHAGSMVFWALTLLVVYLLVYFV